MHRRPDFASPSSRPAHDDDQAPMLTPHAHTTLRRIRYTDPEPITCHRCGQSLSYVPADDRFLGGWVGTDGWGLLCEPASTDNGYTSRTHWASVTR